MIKRSTSNSGSGPRKRGAGAGRSASGSERSSRSSRSSSTGARSAGSNRRKSDSEDTGAYKPKRSYADRSERGEGSTSRSPRTGGRSREDSYSSERPRRTSGNREERGNSREDRPARRTTRGDSSERPARRSAGSDDRGGYTRKKREEGYSDDRPARRATRSEGSERPARRSAGSDDRGGYTRKKREDGYSDDRPARRTTRGDGSERPARRPADSDDRGGYARKKREEGYSDDRPARRTTRDEGSERPARRSTSSEDRNAGRGSRSSGGDGFVRKGSTGGRSRPKREEQWENLEHAAKEYKSRSKSGRKRIPAKTGNAEQEVPKEGIRLNKYLSNAGIASRREADVLIGTGAVSVNGEVITTMGYRVMPGDKVIFSGQAVTAEKPVYILMNKPKDFITTTDDPEGRKTVLDLLKGVKERVYPVGRLDRNTTGVLLLTNDGELAQRLMHPKYEISKIYAVELDRKLSQPHLEEMRKGVELEDGFIKPDELEYETGMDKHHVGIEIHSGRNRIVRRIFEHFGYDVVRLDRVSYGFLTKKDLPRGKWRNLDPEEVRQLKQLTGITTSGRKKS